MSWACSLVPNSKAGTVGTARTRHCFHFFGGVSNGLAFKILANLAKMSFPFFSIIGPHLVRNSINDFKIPRKKGGHVEWCRIHVIKWAVSTEMSVYSSLYLRNPQNKPIKQILQRFRFLKNPLLMPNVTSTHFNEHLWHTWVLKRFLCHIHHTYLLSSSYMIRIRSIEKSHHIVNFQWLKIAQCPLPLFSYQRLIPKAHSVKRQQTLFQKPPEFKSAFFMYHIKCTISLFFLSQTNNTKTI